MVNGEWQNNEILGKYQNMLPRDVCVFSRFWCLKYVRFERFFVFYSAHISDKQRPWGQKFIIVLLVFMSNNEISTIAMKAPLTKHTHTHTQKCENSHHVTNFSVYFFYCSFYKPFFSIAESFYGTRFPWWNNLHLINSKEAENKERIWSLCYRINHGPDVLFSTKEYRLKHIFILVLWYIFSFSIFHFLLFWRMSEIRMWTNSIIARNLCFTFHIICRELCSVTPTEIKCALHSFNRK